MTYYFYMSRFIAPKTDIVVSEDKIEGGYKLRVDVYHNQRQHKGIMKPGDKFYKDESPSYRAELYGYEIKYLDDDGNLHRDGDQPAYQRFHRGGIMEEEGWFTHGTLHRDNELPAFVDVYGTKIWYKDGVITRGDDSQPAYIYRGVKKRWYKDGKLL